MQTYLYCVYNFFRALLHIDDHFPRVRKIRTQISDQIPSIAHVCDTHWNVINVNLCTHKAVHLCTISVNLLIRLIALKGVSWQPMNSHVFVPDKVRFDPTIRLAVVVGVKFS